MSGFETLNAEPREHFGKGGARTLRRAGRLPAIVYGGEGEPMAISLDLREFQHQFEEAAFFTRLYDLKINGDSFRVLPRDVQVDPVRNVPLHVDFLRYVRGAKIAVSVAVRFEGHEECEGLRRGGVLNVVRHDVELLCPVEAIPDVLVADISGMTIGDSLHISHIALPEDVTPTITDRDFTIATLAAPTVHVEEEEEAEEGEELEAAAEGEEAAEAPAEGEEKAEGEEA